MNRDTGPSFPINLAPFGNVTLLERPVRTVTLVSAARTALQPRPAPISDALQLLARQADSVRQRDQFLAILSHELRNPLATIRNATSVIEQLLPKVPSEVQENREMILRQIEHLAQLLDDLLDVSRVTAGKIALRKRPVDLREIARRCTESVAAQAAAFCHDLRVTLPSEPIAVEADPVRIEQIICNLLTNAVKYTPAGGKLSLWAERSDGEAVIHVCDNGVGIPADMLPRVFDLFAQADRSLDRSQGGLGVGLTRVRNLGERRGGSVSAQSEGADRGSEFVVRLPLTREPLAAVAETAPPVRKMARKVLLVEDGPDARKALGRLIRLWGHDVETAADGHEGVARALKTRPDVALVDIGLHGLDGYEVARRIRAASGSEIKLIALTGYGQPEDIARTKEAGFDLHLVKPVDPGNLSKLLADGDCK